MFYTNSQNHGINMNQKNQIGHCHNQPDTYSSFPDQNDPFREIQQQQYQQQPNSRANLNPRKRDFNNVEEEDYDFEYTTTNPLKVVETKLQDPSGNKKLQRWKIHGEVHDKTVNMLMQAQRDLQHRQQNNTEPQPIDSSENSDSESNTNTITNTNTTNTTYTQKPYW